MRPPFALTVEVFLCDQMVSVIFIPQVHPIVDKDLRLDDFLSFEYGILDLACIGHGFLGNLSHFAFLLQLVSSIIFFVSRLFTMSMSMKSSLLDDILRD